MDKPLISKFAIQFQIYIISNRELGRFGKRCVSGIFTLSKSRRMERVQFITNSKGKKTAAVVPIEEWETMKRELDYGVPEWHKELVLNRIDEIQKPGKSWEEVKANLRRKG